jgi:hypothetical protein
MSVVRPGVILLWKPIVGPLSPERRPALTQVGSRSPSGAESKLGQSPLGDRLPHSQCYPFLQDLLP